MRQFRTLGSVRGEARLTMATLNGHEAGNGGYSQEPTYGHVVASPTRSGLSPEPLVSLETMLNFIRTTRTETGLRVRATLVKGDYPKGLKPTAAEMERLPLLTLPRVELHHRRLAKE